MATCQAITVLLQVKQNESSKVVEEGLAGIGATIMGRNMFGGHPGLVPVLLGGGERLLDGGTVPAPDVVHLKFAKARS